MASDEYTTGGGGALKLKGAKVQKRKKKRDKSALEKNLGSEVANKTSTAEESKKDDKADDDDNDDGRPAVQKTEAEKRHEEIKRKRLLQMAESSSSRPELLKTHKERVEELNTYLSRLSEHHDMPRIGPG
ncbi:hypothetical protein AK830_g2513 [Neonectria ditissima]|uniref:DUF1754-domain-containing protein n=1 Tax=Neonectria ditissima TaxID=78410 RepID=A0A0P7BB36_9HYPO|nr:hypothetical protein AK830_g2513 [Neonectria ditissima]